MPGPMSTPMFWTDKVKRNKSGAHGVNAHGPRTSGKTRYDKASGTWDNHIENCYNCRCYKASGGREGALTHGSEQRRERKPARGTGGHLSAQERSRRAVAQRAVA